MNTAVIPSNVSDNLSFYFPTADFVDPRLQYHLFMHFAELRQLRSNESREFNFSIDGEYVYGPFSPSNLSVTTMFTPSPLSGQNYHEISLCKTTSSTLPPILNAVEIFILEPFSTTPTDTKDGKLCSYLTEYSQHNYDRCGKYGWLTHQMGNICMLSFDLCKPFFETVQVYAFQ